MTSFVVKETFPRTAAELYDAWLDDEQHWEMTGAEALIDARVGGTHSAWEGYITGEFLELERGARIVQTWRTSEFPKGKQSRVEITFTPAPGGAEVSIRHDDIPAGQPDYEQGWKEHYFEPMKAYFR